MVKITDMLLTPNKYSRPQSKLGKVAGIVWHWVANKKTTANANRNFFENRKLGKTNFGSAHYIIDLDGSVIRCLPDNEVGYHVGSNTYTKRALKELGSYPNANTIGIECTHLDDKGTMTPETRQALIELTAQLCKKFGLEADDVWLHQEVVGWKDCHRWYVNNQGEYKKDKEAVAKLLNGKPATAPKPVDPKDVEYVEPDASGYYVIRKGDTFWGLSKALGVSVEEITKLNPSVNPSQLAVGQKIKIKSVAVKTHTIVKGDTLWDIANKYKTTVAKLEQLNKGVKAMALQVGGKIIVPSDDKVEAPKPVAKPAPAPAKPVVKPAPKPVVKAHTHKFTKLGRAKGDVWSHTKPDFTTATQKDVVITNAQLQVCCEENGLYYTNRGWISKKYVGIVGDLNSFDLPSATLKRGDRGNSVVQVQRALNKLKFKCGTEDGIYGATTEDAVKRFQMVNDAYNVTGIYNSRVEKKMEALLKK